MLGVRNNFLSNRVVDAWNELPHCHLQHPNHLLLNPLLHFFQIKCPLFISNCYLTLHSCHLIPPPTPLLLKYYHNFLLHLMTELLNSCMPLLINNVTLTLSPPSSYKQVSAPILPIITTIVNLSLSTGTFPMHFKQSPVHCYPLLKKPSLDKDTLNNYRPLSNLSLIFKITERIVKSRLKRTLLI